MDQLKDMIFFPEAAAGQVLCLFMCTLFDYHMQGSSMCSRPWTPLAERRSAVSQLRLLYELCCILISDQLVKLEENLAPNGRHLFLSEIKTEQNVGKISDSWTFVVWWLPNMTRALLNGEVALCLPDVKHSHK